MLIMYLNWYYVLYISRWKSDQNRHGIIYRHTSQRVRGGEDTGKVILRTLNYPPNDDVKSEHSQYMCNVCAIILLEYRELVVLIKVTSVLGYICPKNKKERWNTIYDIKFECLSHFSWKSHLTYWFSWKYDIQFSNCRQNDKQTGVKLWHLSELPW